MAKSTAATMAKSSAATMTKSSAFAAAAQRPPDLLERYRDPKVCDIPATSPVQKPDPFVSLRPKPRTVLDYKISETDTKMQKTLPTGITKVHLKQTTAEYVLPPPGYEFPPEEPPPPPPPEPLPCKHFTGGGPVWEFQEDIWRRKVEKRQKRYHENLKRLIAQNKKFEKSKKGVAHVQLMQLVGPDWYQELSPKQLQTVDKLKNCIVKDLKLKTIINTQENIGELGLVLRPDPRHIQMALCQCCECPVEFLLILYQLMNRRRTKYSLNDRLLLSGVVHLTMRETLKELHIRIPSPPPPRKKPKSPPKREKIKRYKSPYLVPFTFVPAAPKHTGIYKNSHIQYPESPYFSYISELKNEGSFAVDDGGDTEEESKGPKIRVSAKQSGITKEQEKLMIGELRVAQQEYNDLVDYEPVPLLRKPSIYIPCDHGLKKSKTAEELEIDTTKNTEVELELDNEQTNLNVKVELQVTTDFGPSREPIRKRCECKITFDESKVSRYAESGTDSSNSAVEDSEEEGSVHNAALGSNRQTSKADEIVTKTVGVVTDNIAQKMKVPLREDKGAGSALAITTPAVAKSETSENVEEEEGEEGEGEQEVGEKLITVGQRESMECKCKEEVEKMIETTLCPCERCKADRAEREERRKGTNIISGMAEVQLGEEDDEVRVFPVISGVKAKQVCNCMEKYQERARKYEDMKKRFDTQQHLKTLSKQYVISGVTRGSDGGPVYMLSGVKPERECSCAEAYQEQLKEQERLANMPQLPPGMQKYHICGVHATPEGNVYILSGAVPTKDCKCMSIYKKYQEKHAPCLDVYQQYLKKIEMDTQAYLEELAQDERYKDILEVELTEGPEAEDTATSESEQRQSMDSNARENSGGFQHDKESHDNQIAATEVIKSENKCTCNAPASDEDLEIDTTLRITLESIKDQPECVCSLPPPVCMCEVPSEPIICTCGKKVSEESVEPELKRFTILKKIPCDRTEQIYIIKRALEMLAEDGYPLAKLPESYKLPHFKLWMQMRCRKFWTQEDRVDLLVQSWLHWRHAGYCSRKVKEKAKLSLSKHDARKYTWAHASVVRQMAMEKDSIYYRKLRQAVIGDAREFFPSTFSYELPTPNFRDSFFAYAPAKEEACIAWKPWYPHEIKRKR